MLPPLDIFKNSDNMILVNIKHDIIGTNEDCNNNFNDNDSLDHSFQIQVYNSLKNFRGKMHYINTFQQIDEYKIEQLLYTIENDIMEGFNEDPHETIKVFRIILMYNKTIPYNEEFCSKIINSMHDDDIFDNSEFLVFNYILNEKHFIRKETKILIENMINDKDLGSTEKMMRFSSKLIRYYDFQMSFNFYEAIFQKIEHFSYRKKYSFLKLTKSIILTNTKIVPMLIHYLDSIKIFLIEMTENKPSISLFIISSIDEILQSDNFINDINLRLLNLQENL